MSSGVYVELDCCTLSWRASNLNECRAGIFRAPQIVLTGSVHICRAPSTLLVLLLCVHIRANRPKCTRCVRGCVSRDMTSFVCGSNNKSSINLLNTFQSRRAAGGKDAAHHTFHFGPTTRTLGAP